MKKEKNSKERKIKGVQVSNSDFQRIKYAENLRFELSLQIENLCWR